MLFIGTRLNALASVDMDNNGIYEKPWSEAEQLGLLDLLPDVSCTSKKGRTTMSPRWDLFRNCVVLQSVGCGLQGTNTPTSVRAHEVPRKDWQSLHLEELSFACGKEGSV